MSFFLDITKHGMKELLFALRLYADLTEQQIKSIQAEQRERLGDEWERLGTVFTEVLPMNLRQSVIVTLVSHAEWSLGYAVALIGKRGIPIPPLPSGGSKNKHHLKFLKQHTTPEFSHPFERKFFALVTLRNAIVHNAGKPDRLVKSFGLIDVHIFSDKIRKAAAQLKPAVDASGIVMWIEEGAVSAWIEEAIDWLSRLYDSLDLKVGFVIPLPPVSPRGA